MAAISAAPAHAERAGHRTVMAVLIAVIGAAWFVSAWAELSGAASQFHHHALYESGRPLWLSTLMMLAAWQVMTAAMMLPSSLSFISAYGATARNARHFTASIALFLSAYFLVWSAFALFAFAGDMQLHGLVDRWRWLADHQHFIPATTLALAAIYQMTPLKDACLKACRHPGLFLIRHYRRGPLNGLLIGTRHALFCLGCCWALMLVMFAAGVAHLAWMGVLAVVMLIEKGMTAGDRIVAPVGGALALLAIIALLSPRSLPGL